MSPTGERHQGLASRVVAVIGSGGSRIAGLAIGDGRLAVGFSALDLRGALHIAAVTRHESRIAHGIGVGSGAAAARSTRRIADIGVTGILVPTTASAQAHQTHGQRPAEKTRNLWHAKPQ